MRLVSLFIILLLGTGSVLANANIAAAIKFYNPDGKLSADAKRGEEKWHQTQVIEGKERNCTKCHGKDLTKPGKHIKTGKVIDPLAASVNAERFTDMKKIKKWFKRNCKWTFGRECTTQEKIDFLQYLRQF